MENRGLKAILERPFPNNIIKSRKGYNGNFLSYVETVHYIERLNEAFNHQWDWQITDFSILNNEVYCKGKLTVELNGKTIVKAGFGGKEITLIDVYDKQTRKVIGKKNLSIGDDLKSAGSDALKKACSLLGIGLHLYKNKQVNRN